MITLMYFVGETSFQLIQKVDCIEKGHPTEPAIRFVSF